MAKAKRKGGAIPAAVKPAAKKAATAAEEQTASAKVGKPAGPWRRKQCPLVLCSRGITYRYRHLTTDLMQLLPHHKTDSKLDTKHDWNVINEIAELKVLSSMSLACNRAVYQAEKC
jgi:hypothetical protein